MKSIVDRSWPTTAAKATAAAWHCAADDMEAWALVQPAKRLKVVANGDGLGHTLLANPGPVDVVLTLGAHCYCLRFGGDLSFKPNRKFLAKNAPAPSGCPSSASPGGAFVATN